MEPARATPGTLSSFFSLSAEAYAREGALVWRSALAAKADCDEELGPSGSPVQPGLFAFGPFRRPCRIAAGRVEGIVQSTSELELRMRRSVVKSLLACAMLAFGGIRTRGLPRQHCDAAPGPVPVPPALGFAARPGPGSRCRARARGRCLGQHRLRRSGIAAQGHRRCLHEPRSDPGDPIGLARTHRRLGRLLLEQRLRRDERAR